MQRDFGECSTKAFADKAFREQGKEGKKGKKGEETWFLAKARKPL